MTSVLCISTATLNERFGSMGLSWGHYCVAARKWLFRVFTNATNKCPSPLHKRFQMSRHCTKALPIIIITPWSTPTLNLVWMCTYLPTIKVGAKLTCQLRMEFQTKNAVQMYYSYDGTVQPWLSTKHVHTYYYYEGNDACKILHWNNLQVQSASNGLSKFFHKSWESEQCGNWSVGGGIL